MEQKTEASQAVEEPVLPNFPRAVGYRHTMDNTEGLKGNKPVTVFCATKPNPFGIPGLDYSASFPVTTEPLFTASQVKAYARAALKAQPAPTEAAQGDRQVLQAEGKHPAPCARHCEATAFGIEIRRLTAENAQLRAAQGEDSARLDWLRRNSSIGDGIANLQATPRKVRVVRFPVIEGESLNEAIDRARASAETGEVKP